MIRELHNLVYCILAAYFLWPLEGDIHWTRTVSNAARYIFHGDKPIGDIFRWTHRNYSITITYQGILIPITKHTQLVSQMVVVHKIRYKLRICIDFQLLNDALIMEQNKLPTADYVLSMQHFVIVVGWIEDFG